MRSRTKTIVLILSHLLAVTLGVAGGFWYSWGKLREANSMATNWLAITRYGAHVDLQRREANEGKYREALQSWLAMLDEISVSDDPLLNQDILLTDKALAHVRLARLETRAGNGVDAKTHIGNAVTLCKQIPWDNCEPAHLMEISERLEKSLAP